jgi:pimeloyl-ACP methyl ester carboxylesterase
MKVVLLPGLDGTGLLFKPFIEALPKNIETLVISYPRIKKQSYCELVSYVTAQLPEEDYVLVGESFSGNIAYQIALGNPKHLKSVIFVASFLSSPRPLLLTLVNMLPAKILFAVPPPKFIIKAFMFGTSAKNNIIQLFLEALKQVSPDVLSFRLKEIKDLQLSSQPCEVKATYIQATNDYLVPKKSVTSFENLFSNFRVVKVTGSHFILQSKPVECAKILEKQYLISTSKMIHSH